MSKELYYLEEIRVNFRLLLLNILLLSTFVFAQNRKVYVDTLKIWDGSGTTISDYNTVPFNSSGQLKTAGIEDSSITSTKIAEGIIDQNIVLDSTMSTATIQSYLDNISTVVATKITFQKGTYNITDNINILSANKINVEASGAVLNLNENSFTITSASTLTQKYYGYYDTDTYTVLDGLFAEDMTIADRSVQVNSVATWQAFNLQEGDAIMFSDSTTNGGGYYRGEIMYFDTLDVANSILYFQNETRFPVNCYSDLGRSNIVHLGKKTAIISGLNVVDGTIYISGFESLQMSDITNIGSNEDQYSSGASASIYIANCRYFNLTNILSNNYYSTGNGYGLGVDGFESGFITNYKAINNRHPFTTNNSYWWYNGEVTVLNGYAANFAENKNTSGGWDTHGNTWQVNFINCTAKGFSPAIGSRAHNIYVENLKTYDCNNIITIPDARGGLDGTGALTSKKSTILKNIEIYGQLANVLAAPTSTTIDDSAKYRLLDVDNVKFKSDSVMAGSFWTLSNSSDLANIDTVNFKNLDIKVERVNALGRRFISNTDFASNATTFNVDVFNIEDSHIEGFYYFCRVGGFPFKEINIKNSTIKNMHYIFYCTSSTVDKFINITFDNTKIEQITSYPFYGSSDSLLVNRLTFNNIKNYDSWSILRDYKLAVDTLKILNSDFNNLKSVFVATTPSMQNIFVSGNTINSLNGFMAGGALASQHHVYKNNNYYSTFATDIIDLQNGETNLSSNIFEGNIFVVDSLDRATANYLIRARLNSAGMFIDNKFIINKDAGSSYYFFYDAGDGNDMYLDGNHFINFTGTGNAYTATAGTSTLKLGINHYYNTAGLSIGNATLSYIPFNFHGVNIDSTKVVNDSLYFYNGATRLK